MGDEGVGPSKKRPPRPRIRAAAPAAAQQDLIPGQRVFFPCNREDALLFLGSLFVSPGFPLNGVRLPVDGDGIALLTEALRQTEADMLCAGRPERFTLLVEVVPRAGQKGPRTVAFRDIIRLVFRTAQDADDFRFRPVEEYDVEAIGFTIEPALFGAAGAARFTLRADLDDSDDRLGSIADRYVAGVHAAISIGETVETTRECVRGFFDSVDAGPLDSLTARQAATALGIAGSPVELTRRQRAIVQAFADFEGQGADELIEGVSGRLSKDTAAEADRNAERKWETTVRGAVRGSIELDGSQLSDEGSRSLRAAMLAVIVDKPAALVAFINGASPAGTSVVVLASFLSGLKQGVLQTPWRRKAREAGWLSLMLRIVNEGRPGAPWADQLVSIQSDETTAPATEVVSVAGHRITAWPATPRGAGDEVTRRWFEAFASAGYKVVGPGISPNSWKVTLSDEYNVEISFGDCGTIPFPILRYDLDRSRKFRKINEVRAVLERETVFWRKGSSGDREFLYCDLPSLPTGDGRTVVTEKLGEALAMSTHVAKSPKRRAKRPRKAAGNDEQFTVEMLPASGGSSERGR